jgi:hypothetical protein
MLTRLFGIVPVPLKLGDDFKLSIELRDVRLLDHLGEACNVRPELLCKLPGVLPTGS